MTVKKRRKKKNKSTRQVFIFLFIVGFIVVMVVLYQAQQGKQSEPKYMAEEYFEIFDVNYLGAPSENFSGLFVTELSFNLVAVKADAHNVVVQSLAMTEPVLIGNMKKGEAVLVWVPLQNYLYVKHEEGKYPVSIPIISSEAEGKITVYLQPYV